MTTAMLATTTTIPCPRCERPTELGQARSGWHRCVACGSKFKLAEYLPAEWRVAAEAAAAPTAITAPETCRRCGVALRASARHCHQCGAARSSSRRIRLSRVLVAPVMAALLAVAMCVTLAWVAVLRPVAMGTSATVARVDAQPEQLVTTPRTARVEGTVVFANPSGVRKTAGDRVEAGDSRVINHEAVIWRTDATVGAASQNASALPLVAAANAAVNPAAAVDTTELKQQLLAAKAELARYSRAADERLAAPASASRENWQSLIDRRIANPDVTPAEVRRLLGSPDDEGATSWTYRPYLAKGRIQWAGGRIRSITPPADLPR